MLVTAGRKGHLLFIDVVNKKIYKQMQLGVGAILTVPSGKTAMVSITNGNIVLEIDLLKMEVVRKLTGFSGPDAIGWIGK